MSDRVVLAYSGGLDTSVAISWIGKETGAEVVAVAIDLGQGGEDMEAIRQRALDCGAVESVVVDARDEFAEEYCGPTIKANGLYMREYPLVSAISRPLIVKHLVTAAKMHGGTAVAHGCTGKGNDQVRFEVGFGALAPDLDVIAPVRDYAWTREKAIEFAEQHEIPINVTKKSPFSIEELNRRGGAQGVGRLDMVEDRLVGIKSREVYEAPGAMILITAHKALEDVTLERELARYKSGVSDAWSNAVYDGLWFSPLKYALDAFIENTQEHVSGDIRMVLHGGVINVNGRRSDSSLYDFNLATYDEGDTFDQSHAKGFVNLHGLSSKIAAKRDLGL